VSSILKKDKDPFAMQPSLTVDQLSKFFRDKIESVRAATNDADPPTFTVYAGKQFTSFCECSMEEIRRIMFCCPVKTCSLDPIPTDILLESVVVLPLIWAMCNASLMEGILPVREKEAIITPVPKKSSLDLDEPRNYRPISNLSFISTI